MYYPTVYFYLTQHLFFQWFNENFALDVYMKTDIVLEFQIRSHITLCTLVDSHQEHRFPLSDFLGDLRPGILSIQFPAGSGLYKM